MTKTTTRYWPGVSVIIPAHNAEKTLADCLRSVFETDYAGEVEVIVVDDASTDGTRRIAASFPCRLIARPRNAGPASARNVGARAARHELLLFLDADTQMLSDTITEAVRALQQEGVAAVTGTYAREPINRGFFPRYYAYLKRYAFDSSPAEEIAAFGAQCGIISKQCFREVGGFRDIAWGVDIENDELGARIARRGRIALSRRFCVRHCFPSLSKLVKTVFFRRVYWWIIFSRCSGRRETVLMTPRFGWGTAALPAAGICLTAAAAVGGWLPAFLLHAAAAAAIALFLTAYGGFWRFCLRHGGWRFAGRAVLASMMFAPLITLAAACGYARVGAMRFTRREPAYARAAMGLA